MDLVEVTESMSRANEKDQNTLDRELLEIETLMLTDLTNNPIKFFQDKINLYERQSNFLYEYDQDAKKALDNITTLKKGEKSNYMKLVELNFFKYSMLENELKNEGIALKNIQQNNNITLNENFQNKLDYCIRLNNDLCTGYLKLIEAISTIVDHSNK